MGIKYAHTYTYCIKNLTIDNIFTIASQRLKIKNQLALSLRTIPSIDVDCSWIIRGFCKGHLECRVRQLINLSLSFVKAGFNVNLVCDGPERHHSKRATTQRQADVSKRRLEIIVYKAELMMLTTRRRSTDSIEERNSIKEEENLLQTKIRKIELFLQRSSINIGEDFIIRLNEAVNALTINNITVCTALFQADAVMASNIIKNESDVILTSDSDQAAILGEHCLCIKNFKITEVRQQVLVEEIEIFFAFKKTMEECLEILHFPYDTPKIVPARYPVFDNITCYRLTNRRLEQTTWALTRWAINYHTNATRGQA
jgi:hypothetical protein